MDAEMIASTVVLAIVGAAGIPLIVLDGLRLFRHYRKRR